MFLGMCMEIVFFNFSSGIFPFLYLYVFPV